MYPIVRILLNSLGAITVNRGQKNGLVDEIVKEINKKDKIFLQIGPSGKRAKTDKWRSGFYHIANNSGIPLVCGYIDSNTKEAVNSYVYNKDVTVYIKTDSGYISKNKINLINGKGEFYFRALDLQIDDEAEIKIGFKTFSNVLSHTIKVNSGSMGSQ